MAGPTAAPYVPEDNPYPKMLFSPDYLPAADAYKRAAKRLDHDGMLKAHADMESATVLVEDPDDEQDHLDEGYKASPADHLPEDKDPRIHRGPRGRQAARMAPEPPEPAYDPKRNRYPKVMYHKNGSYCHVVDARDERELVEEDADWKESPADHMEVDPRVPRAAKKKKRQIFKGARPTDAPTPAADLPGAKA